jgi:hypothetical protein
MFKWLWSLIQSGFSAIGDFIVAFIEDFKESNKYFKIKVGIISSYVAVSLVTVFVFIPPGDLNEIDAVVRVRKADSIVGGRFFKVQNQSSETWKKIALTLNEDFTAKWPRIRAGKSRSIFFVKFRNSAGKSPDESFRKVKLRIETDQGVTEACFELFEKHEPEQIRCSQVKLGVE